MRVSSLLNYAVGVLPLEAYEVEFGKTASPGTVLQDLSDALSRGIDELSRPIDAIKHQAKTVTVGISRSQDALLRTPFVKAVLAAAPILDRLSYRALRTLAALDPAVAEVTGYTRYRVDGDVGDKATIHVVDQGGRRSASRPAPTPTRPCGAPSGGRSTPARSPSRWAAGTAAPSCWCRRPRAGSRWG